MIIRLNPTSVDYRDDPIIEDQGRVIGTEADLDDVTGLLDDPVACDVIERELLHFLQNEGGSQILSDATKGR